MLRFTVDGQTYDWDDDHVLNTEAIALKKSAGITVLELMEGVSEFDAEAVTAMVWLAKRRAGETEPDGKPLLYSALEFDMGQLDLHMLDADGNRVQNGKAGEAEDPSPSPSEGSATT